MRPDDFEDLAERLLAVKSRNVTLDLVDLSEPQQAVVDHLEAFFRGHEVRVARPIAVRVGERAPGFAVASIGSGPRLQQLRTVVSLGCWDATHEGGHGLEFAIVGPEDADERLAELLALTAFYHCGPPAQRLDHGHTVPIGEAWLPGSACDHLLVSLPYPFGPEFETCAWTNAHARILWLLPISAAERSHKAEHGLEALEEKFDEGGGMRFWDPLRPSVV